MKDFYPFRAGQTHKERLVQRQWLAKGSGEARSPPGREKGQGRKGDAHRESEGRVSSFLSACAANTRMWKAESLGAQTLGPVGSLFGTLL